MAFPIGAVLTTLGGLAVNAAETETRKKALDRIKNQKLAAELMRRAQTQALFDQFRASAAERRGVNSATLLRGAQEQAVRGGARIAGATAAAGAQEQNQRNQLLLQQGNRETDFLRGTIGGALDAVGTGITQSATSDVGSNQQAQTAAPTQGAAFTAPQDQFTSDKRLKSQIKNATGLDEDEFIEALNGRRFMLFGQDRTGVMAQELQQTDIGQEMVSEAPDGSLQVDGQRALEATMGATGRLGERLQRIEALMDRANRLEQLRDAPNLTDEQRTIVQRALPPRERSPQERRQLGVDVDQAIERNSPELQGLQAAAAGAERSQPEVAYTGNPARIGKPADPPRTGAPQRSISIGDAIMETPPAGALGQADRSVLNTPGSVGTTDDAVTFSPGAHAQDRRQLQQAQTTREEEERRRQMVLQEMQRRGLLPGGRTL